MKNSDAGGPPVAGPDMSPDMIDGRIVRDRVDRIYREESRRILATLVRQLRDLDLAEEALHEAFRAAVEQWPRDGVPDNPRAWLVSAGRFKAIDTIRRRSRIEALGEREDTLAAPEGSKPEERAMLEEVPDDQLRLIFVCCHPDIPVEGRVALTLREVCGLTTEEIAQAYLTRTSTVAQRIVRAKARIRDRNLPIELPPAAELHGRMDTVLQVIYLVFNEGYSTSAGPQVMRVDLTGEAIRLARHLVELLPDPEAMGLLALMLLHDSRRSTRTDEHGDIVLLEEQDRSRWDRKCIDEGLSYVEKALASRRLGGYTLQAAIAATHALARRPEDTDWGRIVTLYDMLLTVTPSPVVELNRAVAVAMRDTPAAGITLVKGILERGDLSGYYLAHAAQADLMRREGDVAGARVAYRQALKLVRQEPERRFLERRLRELEKLGEHRSQRPSRAD